MDELDCLVEAVLAGKQEERQGREPFQEEP